MITISLQAVLGASTEYVDDGTAAAIESLPEAAWPALVQACAEINGGDAPGIDCSVSATRETLADFDDSRARHWSEKGERTALVIAGFQAVKLRAAPAQPGAGASHPDRNRLRRYPRRAALSPVLLARAGRALYGERWQSEMARALEISDRTMRRWVAGASVPAAAAVDLLRLALERAQDLDEVVELLRKGPINLPPRQEQDHDDQVAE